MTLENSTDPNDMTPMRHQPLGWASGAHLFVCAFWSPAGGGGAGLLALVCGVYCEFVTFPLVSWVRCGA